LGFKCASQKPFVPWFLWNPGADRMNAPLSWSYYIEASASYSRFLCSIVLLFRLVIFQFPEPGILHRRLNPWSHKKGQLLFARLQPHRPNQWFCVHEVQQTQCALWQVIPRGYLPKFAQWTFYNQAALKVRWLFLRPVRQCCVLRFPWSRINEFSALQKSRL